MDTDYIDNDPSKGGLIKMDNKERLILPVIAKFIAASGKEATMNLLVKIWQGGNTCLFHYPSTNKIAKVILNPEGILPGRDRINNE